MPSKPGVGDEEMKREKRREANRRSARKSRYREIVMLEELQRSSRDLSTKNSSLLQENESLRSLTTSVRRYMVEAQQQVAGLVSCPCVCWDHTPFPPFC